MRQQVAPYVMPVCYAIVGVILIVGMVLIAVRALSAEAWSYFWERM